MINENYRLYNMLRDIQEFHTHAHAHTAAQESEMVLVEIQ